MVLARAADLLELRFVGHVEARPQVLLVARQRLEQRILLFGGRNLDGDETRTRQRQ